MVNRYDLGLCLLLMLALLPVPVRGEPLPWALLPLPGVVELQEDCPPSGMQVEALRLLEARMPDIQPSYRAVNYRRLQQDMAQGMDFCAAPFFRRADSDRIGFLQAAQTVDPRMNAKWFQHSAICDLNWLLTLLEVFVNLSEVSMKTDCFGITSLQSF